MTPRLRRGVRLTYDRTRQTHVLLFPEGVLVTNPTAAAVLELCDGERTVPDIVAALGTRYAGVREADVDDVLARLVDRQVVEWT
ncbi:pyrroloquinoline quinone biosynthesis peptide chaperone PqqD [Prauserella cavernicola]|uniref:Pyrroloquinoline quinone biosynthesis peptide chaperone PqqD n=1 Tax=Prauserella cavernicola TaxID=2800127 RepID=A0A934QRW0_9PSEU|nr:pyrroloquinoline quinone biosynthesis peptide chaperone PqqD [Prauserella cavernicola]MBK1785071.1 pyrroloquinoline quinone biosynthesis peptide chaperone PqqD [Prauserella cavernicola]